MVRAQTREIFIGGPAIPGLTDGLFPLIEKKHNIKVLFEGTNSLINLEKMRSNKARPTMTLTMMDDPVLVIAEREKLIKKLPAEVTNLADIIPGAKPRGMWANWCQPLCSFSYNTKALPNGLASYAEAWDPKFKERIIVISMRITQAIAPLLAATHHVTKKPLSECLPEWQAGIERMKELRPNIMQVSTNYPQAQQLNETGECDLFMSPDFPHHAVPQGARGAGGPGHAQGGPVRDAGRRRPRRGWAEPGRRHHLPERDAEPRDAGLYRQNLLFAPDQREDGAAAGPELPRPRLPRLGVFRRQPHGHDRALRAGGVGSMTARAARAEIAPAGGESRAIPRGRGRHEAIRAERCPEGSQPRPSAQAEFVSLLGPSGCGKTTLLRLVAGLLSPTPARSRSAGRELTRVAAHKRNIGVVFQNYALFPHLTVAENVAFGLQAQGAPKAEIGARVREALALVRMEDFADRSVTALSGGQQQRIAVARAIVVKPTLLLLDEPFSALDRKLRETMQIEMRHLLRDLGITSIFVTHDQEEALVMSDRVAVMNEGRIEHLGTPAEVYAQAEDALRDGVRRTIDPDSGPRSRREPGPRLDRHAARPDLGARRGDAAVPPYSSACGPRPSFSAKGLKLSSTTFGRRSSTSYSLARRRRCS